MVEYFKELEEESIRDNFVIIYELLDEMMDFGYPQTTETKILQEYITQESHKLEIQARPPIAVTNAVSWRSEGIMYRKNEVFLDVIESVNLLVNSNGNVLRSEILGAIKMKCYLSGMPELRLGLNDKVMFESTGRTSRGKSIEMEDVKFHQCVRLSRFENDRTISFIPPDGEFELMSYRLNSQVLSPQNRANSGETVNLGGMFYRIAFWLPNRIYDKGDSINVFTYSRQKRSLNVAQPRIMSKLLFLYQKTQILPVSAPQSEAYTTSPKSQQ